ncbi:MAG: hypothetical protein ACRCT8_14885 [Lacipirellulaceae bacterium]
MAPSVLAEFAPSLASPLAVGLLRAALAALVVGGAALASGQEAAPAIVDESVVTAADFGTNRYAQPAAPQAFLGQGAAPAAADPRAGLYQRAPQGANTVTPTPGAPTPLERVTDSNRARVSKGSGQLPNDAGQVWREYDIRPFTMRAGDAVRPQQAIVDWVLAETGPEAWHSEALGILHASPETLTVYHTPAMQGIVGDVVDRFVNTTNAQRAFYLRVVTVRDPDWRLRATSLMTPVAVQSPGVQGWVMAKEDYALLVSQLAKRGDVREFTAANQAAPNGRQATFSTMRPRSYVKGVVPTGAAWPGYQPEGGSVDEGASLDFRPLLALDGGEAEARIKLRLHQVEKLEKVTLQLPPPGGGQAQGARLEIEVPQMTMAHLDERFRWPADRVLVLSLGMIAPPMPSAPGGLSGMLPMLAGPQRADALLFVEARDPATPSAALAPLSTAGREPGGFTGRY